jgi:hypothetical protein
VTSPSHREGRDSAGTPEGDSSRPIESLGADSGADLDLAGVCSYVEPWLRRSCRATHDRAVKAEGAAMARAHD